MKILEKFIEGKYIDQSLCEDDIFISNDFVAVVDGATAKSDKKINGKTSGKIATEVIIASMTSMPQKATAVEGIKHISNALKNFYIENGIYEEMFVPFADKPTASIIIFSNYQKEIWVVGDCQALIDEEYINNDKLIDKIVAEARAMYLQIEIDGGKTVDELLVNDTGRKFILQVIDKQTILQNTDKKHEFAYNVIDGFKVDESGIRIIDVKEAKKIVLASDGYPKVFPTLKESEDYLNHLRVVDPLCYKLYKSTKGFVKTNNSFDDRAYVSFES